ncbi:MAG TPA: chemotaxis protein CheW [Oligoflexus sp.]|uniref:chemotaxis protein CheW n=1 Tax=Oligoflexus sp. TaxID=1971216 RepID=UPI002D2E65F6|nr:chemotaxis protein CheW [Oligoflexus sp.]HYX40037.1 chemotaxis protein CheW [Oligoflexus sp.]
MKANQDALEEIFSSGAAKSKLVFQERAERMAARVRKSTHVDTISVMTFQLGKERYCLPIADLAEIIPYADCTPIPGCPPELKGAVSIRGEIRCVIDLSAILDLPVLADDESRGYILLLRGGEFEVGLKVTNVHQVETIAKASIDCQDGFGASMVGQYVKGVGNGALIFLNLNAVLSHSIFKGVA